MIYAIELDRSEVGHVEPVCAELEKMGKQVVRIYSEEQVTGGRGFDGPIGIKQTDTVLCVGDRLQLMRFLVNHCPSSRIVQLHAGEQTSDSMDDSRWRWVISELATTCIAPTSEACWALHDAQLPWAMGGSPCLENAAERRSEALACPPLNGRDYVLFAHNGYRAIDDGEWVRALKATADAAARRGWWTYVVAPNKECCPEHVLTAEQNKLVQSTYSVGHAEFQRLIAGAIIMVGNSSAGLIEAPSLGTPTLNLGTRQNGRPRSASVVDVPIAKLDSMGEQFNEALEREFNRTPYALTEHPAVVCARIVARVSEC